MGPLVPQNQSDHQYIPLRHVFAGPPCCLAAALIPYKGPRFNSPRLLKPPQRQATATHTSTARETSSAASSGPSTWLTGGLEPCVDTGGAEALTASTDINSPHTRLRGIIWWYAQQGGLHRTACRCNWNPDRRTHCQSRWLLHCDLQQEVPMLLLNTDSNLHPSPASWRGHSSNQTDLIHHAAHVGDHATQHRALRPERRLAAATLIIVRAGV
jgi:hypothetical protein